MSYTLPLVYPQINPHAPPKHKVSCHLYPMYRCHSKCLPCGGLCVLHALSNTLVNGDIVARVHNANILVGQENLQSLDVFLEEAVFPT